MKNILSPTDFSQASQRTLPYLREFYRRFQTEITLLHTYEVRRTGGMLIRMDDILREDAIRRLERWKSELAKGLDSEEGIHSTIVQGGLVDVFAKMAETGKFDMALLGTSGVSGFLEMVEGSFTNRLLKKTSIPILAIPEDFDYRPFDTIVLAVDDLMFEDPDFLAPLLSIVKEWNSTVWVYHKDTGDSAAPSIEALKEVANVNYFHEPVDEDGILESILKFCQDKEAGLLCMIRHKQTFLEQSLNISTTSQSLFSAMLPMLFLSE
jgi:nucleotide-binding universal stress UspA family protein